MTCALCHQERVPANLLELEGKHFCPECLYELALRAMARRGLTPPTLRGAPGAG
jgi:hypothetical protein